MKRTSLTQIVLAIFFFAPIFSLFPLISHAGQGLIPVTDGYVYIAESRETIIAAWGGTEEVLILSTELVASKKTTVIRYIALPTRPTVEVISPEVLLRLEKLVVSKAPKITMSTRARPTTKAAGIDAPLISETTISPISTTVVRVESVEAFERWVSDLMTREGIKDPAPIIERHRAVVGDYLARGNTYFVFDIITVGEKKAATHPVMIRFATDSLFVPFAISSRTSGTPAVNLFLLAPGTPKDEAIPYLFNPISYKLPEGIDFAKYPELLKKYRPLTFSKEHPVSFPVSMIERVALSPAAAVVVPGWETKTSLTAVRFRGDLSSLTADLVLDEKDFASADFGTAAVAMENAREFEALAPDDMVNILASGDDAHTTTGGSDPYTSGAAADGDLSTPYILPLFGEWTVDLSEEREMDGVEIVAAVTKPDIVPSKNRLCLFASDTGEFSGEEKRIDTCVVRSYTPSEGPGDPALKADRVVLTDKRFSTRFLKITYPYSESISNIYLFEVMPWGEKED